MKLSTLRAEGDPIQVADITDEKIGANSIMNKDFFPEAKSSRLVLRKDHSGKAFLVKAKTPKFGVTPEQEDIVIAQKKDKDVDAR